MGGWGLNAGSNYSKRYRFNGNLFMSYNVIQIGREEFLESGGTFQNSRDFNIRWTHNQDPKASPNLRFTASVNLASGTFFQNTQQLANQVLTSQLQSNVSVQKSWQGKPYTLSVNLRHSQNNQQRTYSLTLPQLAFNVNRFFPFKRARQVGSEAWYEKIGMNYSFETQNRINGSLDDNILSEENFRQNASYGATQRSTIQTNVKVFRYLTLTPSVSMENRWYGSRLNYSLDSATNSVRTDTINGFNNVFDFRASANLATKVYGQFNYRGYVKAIRHVMTPTAGLSYRPDFGSDFWGYYQTFATDTNGNTQTRSVYNGYLYGTPGQGVQANVKFSSRSVVRSI
jgi:hypothetical protein